MVNSVASAALALCMSAGLAERRQNHLSKKKRDKTRDKGGDKRRNQKEPGNHDGTDSCFWAKRRDKKKDKKRDKKGDKGRNQSRNQEEPGNHDGIESFFWTKKAKKEETRRETRRETSAGTRAEPRETRKSWWNRLLFLSKKKRDKKKDKKRDKKGNKRRNQSRNQEEPGNHDGTIFFWAKREETRRETRGKHYFSKPQKPWTHQTSVKTHKHWEHQNSHHKQKHTTPVYWKEKTLHWKTCLKRKSSIKIRSCSPQKHLKTEKHKCSNDSFTRTLYYSFLLLSRWGSHAARFRHGPHPCWLWRLCLFYEPHASFECIQDLPFGSFQVSP